jgi:hypothetical protein
MFISSSWNNREAWETPKDKWFRCWKILINSLEFVLSGGSAKNRPFKKIYYFFPTKNVDFRKAHIFSTWRLSVWKLFQNFVNIFFGTSTLKIDVFDGKSEFFQIFSTRYTRPLCKCICARGQLENPLKKLM